MSVYPVYAGNLYVYVCCVYVSSLLFLTTELSPTTNSFLEEAKYTLVHYSSLDLEQPTILKSPPPCV